MSNLTEHRLSNLCQVVVDLENITEPEALRQLADHLEQQESESDAPVVVTDIHFNYDETEA